MSDNSEPSWFRRMLSEQPALLVSVLYLFASLIGLVYSWAFLQAFNINVLQYSEIGDFLLASLKEPVIWLLVVLALVLVQSDSALSRRVQRRGPSRWMRWYGSGRYRKLNYLVSAVLVLAVLLAYAQRNSDAVLAGAGEEIRLELADGSPATTRVLLGTTINYLFVYDRESERVLVHPSENVLSLSRRLPGSNEMSAVAPPQQEGSEDDPEQSEDGARNGTLDEGDTEAQE